MTQYVPVNAAQMTAVNPVSSSPLFVCFLRREGEREREETDHLSVISLAFSVRVRRVHILERRERSVPISVPHASGRELEPGSERDGLLFGFSGL